MTFTYKAVTKESKVIKGEMEAKDSQEVVTYLHSHDMIPVSISKGAESSLIKLVPFFNSNKFDITFFTRQLSSMLTSGLTIVQSLNVLKDQAENPYALSILTSILTDVESGIAFSQAISKYPKIFDPVYISLIKAAESSGLFDKVLQRLSDNLEKKQKLAQTIRSALMYPAIVLVGMIGVMAVMTIFVVPQFSTLYTSLNVKLPFTTQIVIGFSGFILKFWFLVIGFIALFVYAFRKWHRTNTGKITVDALSLKIPVFGKIIRESTLAEFTRTFGLLIGAGGLIVEALNESAHVVHNSLYTHAILGVAERVEKGLTIGDAFYEFDLFPPLIVEMAKIGEQTGKLDENLLRVSEYFEREVDNLVKNLTTLIEPFIVVLLGGGVAFLIVSVITPIYSLISSIK